MAQNNDDEDKDNENDYSGKYLSARVMRCVCVVCYVVVHFM